MCGGGVSFMGGRGGPLVGGNRALGAGVASGALRQVCAFGGWQLESPFFDLVGLLASGGGIWWQMPLGGGLLSGCRLGAPLGPV